MTDIQQIEPDSDLHYQNVNRFAPPQQLSRDDDDLVVREFEQYGKDEKTRRQIEPNQELNDLTKGVWSEIQDVEKELQTYQQGPFGPASEFMQQFSPEDRELLLKTLADEGVKPQDEEDVLDMAEIDRLVEEDDEDVDEGSNLAITLHVPRSHQALVKHFNKALEEAKENSGDDEKILKFWRWYLRCRQKIPGFSRIVSESVWDFLWTSQRQLEVRPQHLVMLGQDMLLAGEEMDHQRSLEYVQALLACNDTANALSKWEEMQAELLSKESNNFLSDFYTTGVQLYASVGRPQKAHVVAFTAIQKGVSANILVHVVSGWARSRGPESATKAWAVYLKMRSILGDEMTTEQYDQVSNALLDTNHSAMALAVFKDMIAGIRGSGRNTLQSYQKALGKISTSADPEQVETAINQVSLKMMTALPPAYQNKYFFGSWIKKLLGEQRIEAASMVVDLMYERNIKPDAVHLNGIIGAWLRDKSPGSREQAEKLATEMVQARVNQIAKYEPTAGLTVLRRILRTGGTKNAHHVRLERPIPAANLETFSLLFDYHEQRHQWQKFESLTSTMLGPAQLKANSFVMNKWLTAELQSRSYNRFWRLYRELTVEIPPNIETFALAWQANMAQISGGQQSAHKEVFARLIDWAHKLKARQLRTATEDLEESSFYSEIIKAFCFQLDLPGTICAMQGLHNGFGATPDDASVQLITGQVARLLPKTDSTLPRVGGRRRITDKLAPDQTTLKAIADIIDTLEAEKKLDMVEQHGADPDDIENTESEAYKKLRLDVMTEFLVMMLHRTQRLEDTNPPSKKLQDVAKVMHVNISHVDAEIGRVQKNSGSGEGR